MVLLRRQGRGDTADFSGLSGAHRAGAAEATLDKEAYPIDCVIHRHSHKVYEILGRPPLHFGAGVCRQLLEGFWPAALRRLNVQLSRSPPAHVTGACTCRCRGGSNSAVNPIESRRDTRGHSLLLAGFFPTADRAQFRPWIPDVGPALGACPGASQQFHRCDAQRDIASLAGDTER